MALNKHSDCAGTDVSTHKAPNYVISKAAFSLVASYLPDINIFSDNLIFFQYFMMLSAARLYSTEW
jgi:hypothetical protein